MHITVYYKKVENTRKNCPADLVPSADDNAVQREYKARLRSQLHFFDLHQEKIIKKASETYRRRYGSVFRHLEQAADAYLQKFQSTPKLSTLLIAKNGWRQEQSGNLQPLPADGTLLKE